MRCASKRQRCNRSASPLWLASRIVRRSAGTGLQAATSRPARILPKAGCSTSFRVHSPSLDRLHLFPTDFKFPESVRAKALAALRRRARKTQPVTEVSWLPGVEPSQGQVELSSGCRADCQSVHRHSWLAESCSGHSTRPGRPSRSRARHAGRSRHRSRRGLPPERPQLP